MKEKVRKMGIIILVGIMTLLFAQFAVAGPSISKESESRVTSDANTWWDDRYGDAYINCVSFNQDTLITFNGWQYATYFNQNRYVVVSRRQLPNGSWEHVVLTDYQNNNYDNHNTISMGISPTDGRIHLAFDHHTSSLHYRVSVSGLASNPSNYSWNTSQFGSVTDNLGSGSVTSVTYPHFMVAPNNTFLFYTRIGTSGDGDNHIWRYNNNGSWAFLGQFLEGGGENAYFHGICYDRNNRLHATWCWRATSDGYTNHDLCYAYSDDHGNSWKNNSGSTLATTGSDPINPGKNFTIYSIPQYGGLINQEGMITDNQNRVHVISREDISGTNYQMHYWRDTGGSWHRVNTGIRTKIWDNRSKIAFDTDGNVYGVLPNIQIASASVSSNYTDWSIVNNSDDGQFVHSEPLLDRIGLRAGNNEMYVFAQAGTSSSTSSNIYVIRYALNASQSTPQPTAQPTPVSPEDYPIVYSVSSEPETEHPGSNILDGNLDGESRWSAQGYPQNIVIDYGSTRNFASVSLYTYENRDYQYRVELSNSPGSGYWTIADRSSNTSTASPITDTFGTQSGRYIRITVTGASTYTGDWISLIEFEASEEAAATPTPTPAPTSAGNLGDVNNDGMIDIVDALLVAQYYVGLNPSNFDQSKADTNCDGNVDIVDALLIAQYYVGLITDFC